LKIKFIFLLTNQILINFLAFFVPLGLATIDLMKLFFSLVSS